LAVSVLAQAYRTAARFEQRSAAKFVMLFQFGPSAGFAVVGDFDDDYVRTAANRAVFDVFLSFALREVDRNDDLFAARAADVRGFGIHSREPLNEFLCRTFMASSQETRTEATRSAAEATLAKALAPEEIRVGDFVTPLHVVAEVPSYFWFTEAWNLPADEPVRIRLMSYSDGLPMKVKSICLPFVLVKQASGQGATLDLRKCQLARLDRDYAKRAWRAYVKVAKKQSGTGPRRCSV
jgi:hypothetical protein